MARRTSDCFIAAVRQKQNRVTDRRLFSRWALADQRLTARRRDPLWPARAYPRQARCPVSLQFVHRRASVSLPIAQRLSPHVGAPAPGAQARSQSRPSRPIQEASLSLSSLAVANLTCSLRGLNGGRGCLAHLDAHAIMQAGMRGGDLLCFLKARRINDQDRNNRIVGCSFGRRLALAVGPDNVAVPAQQVWVECMPFVAQVNGPGSNLFGSLLLLLCRERRIHVGLTKNESKLRHCNSLFRW